MLVLGFHEGESVLIGEYRVTVTQAKFGSVKLGFEAPRDVKIIRQKVLNRMNSQQLQQFNKKREI